MSETLKGGDAEWLERPEDGFSPEQRKEKGQVEFIISEIVKEIEQQEMDRTFESLGRPKNMTVEQVRKKTDFEKAPEVREALREVMIGAEMDVRQNNTSFKEGLAKQVGIYRERAQEASDEIIKGLMVDRAAWGSVLIEGLNGLELQVEPESNGDALPGDIL